MKTTIFGVMISMFLIVGCTVTTNQGSQQTPEQDQAEPAQPEQPAEPTEPPPSESEQGGGEEAPAPSGDFTFNLYRELIKEESNLFYSPFSLSAALAMTYKGAAGETEKQMSEALGFPLPQDPLHQEMSGLVEHLNVKKPVTLHTANALWPSKTFPFDKSYLGFIKKKYKAWIQALDYNKPGKAVKTINSWTSRNTKKKIEEIVDTSNVDPNTVLVLTNAIYFKGPWGDKFDPERTTNIKFHVTKEKVVEAPMMNRVGQANFYEDDTVQVLELPYKGDRFSMIAALPKDQQGLAELEKNLSEELIKEWTGKFLKQKTIINLPKFKVETDVEISKLLKALGMTDAFEGSKANFSLMLDKVTKKNSPIFISDVLHKAVVEVTEEGTEAAAASAVTMRKGGRPAKFFPDHPFMFVIFDKETSKYLFVGRILDPTL